MFQSVQSDCLRQELDQFQVPMFVAERSRHRGRFRVRAINAAYERLSGVMQRDLQRTPLSEIVPRQLSDRVHAGVLRTSGLGQMLRRAKTPHRPEVTICPVPMTGRRQRIIGTVMQVTGREQIRAFEDVRHFSQDASYQLARIAQVMEAVQAGQLDLPALRGSAQILAGICRSVDHSLGEMRATAERQLRPAIPVVTDLVRPADARLRETARCLVDMGAANESLARVA